MLRQVAPLGRYQHLAPLGDTTASSTFWTPGLLVAVAALGVAGWLYFEKRKAHSEVDREARRSRNRAAVARAARVARGERRARERGFIE